MSEARRAWAALPKVGREHFLIRLLELEEEFDWDDDEHEAFLAAIAVLEEATEPEDRSVVVSEPGAAIEVRVFPLTDEERKALALPPSAVDALLGKKGAGT